MSSNTNRVADPTRAWARACLCLCLLALWSGVVGCAKREAPDPAALLPDWRTYYNREVGVELRYPYTLSLEVDSAAVAGQLVVELQWLGRQTPVFKLQTTGATAQDQSPPAVAAELMVGGLPAFQTIDAGGEGEEIQRVSVVSGGRLFTFSGAGDSFAKILESVKFLEQGDAAGAAGVGAPAHR